MPIPSLVEPIFTILVILLIVLSLWVFVYGRRVSKDPKVARVAEPWKVFSASEVIDIKAFRAPLTAIRANPSTANSIRRMHIVSSWLSLMFGAIIFFMFCAYFVALLYWFSTGSVSLDSLAAISGIAVIVVVCIGSLLHIGIALWDISAPIRIKRWLTHTGMKFADFDELFAHCTFTALGVPGIWRLPIIVVRRDNCAVSLPLQLNSLHAMAIHLVRKSREDVE